MLIKLRFFGKVTEVRFEHPRNVFSVSLVIPDDNDILRRFVQFKNAPAPIELIVSGMTTDSTPELKKAFSAIAVTVLPFIVPGILNTFFELSKPIMVTLPPLSVKESPP